MIAAAIFYAVASVASFSASFFATLAAIAASFATLATSVSSSFASFSAKPTLSCKTSSNLLKGFRQCVELPPPSPLRALGALSLLQVIDVLIGVLVGVLVVAAACVVAALAVRHWHAPQQQADANTDVLSRKGRPQQQTQKQRTWSLVRAVMLPPIETPSDVAAAPNGKWAAVRKRLSPRLSPSDSGGKVVKPYTSVLELIAPETQRRRELWQAELEQKAALRRGSYRTLRAKASPEAPLESGHANQKPSPWSKVRGAALLGVRKPLESSAGPRLKALSEMGTEKMRAEWQQEKQLRNEKAAQRPRQLTKGFSEPRKLYRQPRASSPTAASSSKAAATKPASPAATYHPSPLPASATCVTSTLPHSAPQPGLAWLLTDSPSYLQTYVTGPSSPVRTFLASISPPSSPRLAASSPQPHSSPASDAPARRSKGSPAMSPACRPDVEHAVPKLVSPPS